jgi:serine/threonine-protein kinase
VNPFNPALSTKEIEEHFPQFGKIEYVAQGGQGVVLVSHETGSQSKMAIKIYFPGSHPDRTQREIGSLKRLNTPFISRFRASGAITLRGETCLYVVTDFIEGHVLSYNVALGPMDEAVVIHVGYGVANAIEEMWQLRIVHRDIKPANIMLKNNGNCVLIDLGIARHLNSSSLTTMGKTWGTEGYMSPEHARAFRQLSCKSDVFSLGITLLECLLGAHPTNGNQYALSAGVPRSASIRRGLSPKLAQVIDSMVEYRPECRPLPSELIKIFSS